MAMAAPIYYTADTVRAIIDEDRAWPRYELVHGELLVTPAPLMWHQALVGRVYVALEAYLRQEPVGYPFLSPAEISWGPDTLVQPDVFVTTLEDARRPNPDWEGVRNLLLATEVLSPSTARYDRFAKRRLYQEVGVPLYWIVDPEEEQVEVMDSDGPLSSRRARTDRVESFGSVAAVHARPLPTLPADLSPGQAKGQIE